MDQKLLNKLNKRKEEGTLRSLSHLEYFSDFYSNDYLGLASYKTDSISNVFGSTGSRLISGNNTKIIEAEQQIASFFNAQAGLMFNSGFDANLGFFSSVPQRGDVVLFDELIHASVRDGMRLNFADCTSFKHNDLFDLEKKMKQANGTIYVAVEALYSMDGDLSPLRKISNLCKKFGAFLIVDEAHSAGVFGEDGKGLVAALNMEQDVFARLITFGKAYGSHGGCILGASDLISYLVNFSRSFIYTTALPEESYLRNAQMIQLDSINSRRRQLQELLTYFRANFEHKGLISEVNSPIQILEVGGVEVTRSLAEKLQSERIAVKPIYSPTVKAGKERLRICIHSSNTLAEIDNLISVLTSEKG